MLNTLAENMIHFMWILGIDALGKNKRQDIIRFTKYR